MNKGTYAPLIVAHLTQASQRRFCAVRHERISEVRHSNPIFSMFIRTHGSPSVDTQTHLRYLSVMGIVHPAPPLFFCRNILLPTSWMTKTNTVPSSEHLLARASRTRRTVPVLLPCTTMTLIKLGSYRRAGTPAEPNRKRFRDYRLPCEGGG